MIGWYNQVNIKLNENSLTIYYKNNKFRSLKIAKRGSKVQLRMESDKGYLILDNYIPKLTTKLVDYNNQKKVLVILQVTDDNKYSYYNASISCNNKKEVDKVFNELKEGIIKVWDRFNKLKSIELSKLSNKNEFSDFSRYEFTLEIPKEVEDKIKS